MEKHAYLILCHEVTEVLKVLLHQLDDERNDIYLHFDKKASIPVEKLKELSVKRAQLQVLPNPVAVYWAHTSLMEAELLLLRTASADGPHAYYHLLSGSDLPIKTQDEIHTFFQENQGREFVEYWNDEKSQYDALRRVRYYYVFNRYKKRASFWIHAFTTPIRNIFLIMQKLAGWNRLRGKEIEIKKGSQWFSITEACCRYVLDHESDIYRLFHHTLCPDELFLQTIVWNSPFRKALYNIDNPHLGSMRAIDWDRGNPYVWQKTDMDYLKGSPYLFARKFAEPIF